jgi:hypothetical protein
MSEHQVPEDPLVMVALAAIHGSTIRASPIVRVMPTVFQQKVERVAGVTVLSPAALVVAAPELPVLPEHLNLRVVGVVMESLLTAAVAVAVRQGLVE